jgi:hypothetical protein
MIGAVCKHAAIPGIHILGKQGHTENDTIPDNEFQERVEIVRPVGLFCPGVLNARLIREMFQKEGFWKKWINGGTEPFPVLCEIIKNKITRKREIPTPTPYCNS